MTNRTESFARVLVRGALCAALAAALSAAACGASITLRTGARLAPGAQVTLADVALLEGGEAEALASVVLADHVEALAQSGRGVAEVTPDCVRKALDTRRVNWGRLVIRGGACVVRFAPQNEPEAPASAPARAAREAGVVDLSGPATIRRRVAATLAQHFCVAGDDLRLLFDPTDEDLLSQGEAGRRVEVQPEAAPVSGRMPVRVRVYEGDRTLADRTIRVDAQVRRSALVVVGEMRRGQTIGADDLRQDTMWVDPAIPPAPALERVVGQKSRGKLPVGTLLRAEHLESPIVVKRGELISVRALSGGVVLTAKARPLADAREGDIVEMRLDGASKTFRARVDGRGRAVADLDAGDRPPPAGPPADKEKAS